MKTFLAIDFGGTRSRAALFDDELRMLRRSESLSNVEDGMDAGLKRLISLGKSLIEPDTKLASIGIAAPGPLDAEQGHHHRGLYFAGLVAGADRRNDRPRFRRYTDCFTERW